MRVQVACAPNALRLPPHRALRITKRSTMPLPLPMTAFSHQSTPRPVLATQGIATQALGLLAEVSSPLSFSLPLAVPLVALGCAALLAWVDARSRIALPAVQLPQQQPLTPAPDLEAGHASQAAKTAEGGASGGMSSSSSNGCSALSPQFHQEVLSRCPTIMKRPYRPVPFLTNRHVETIFASRFRRTPPIVYRREILHMHDGGSVALDWELDFSCALELPGNAPILILLAGLTGGSSDSYVVYAVQRAREAGIRAVVFNSRGTADSPVTSPQYYSASFTGDLREVVAHVQQRHPDSLLLAAGWSLGANILVRYLGEEGTATPLKAAVSMCNPFDMTISNANLRRGFNKIYDINLGNGLRRIHSKHLLLWNGIQPPFRPDLAARCRNIREFDEALTIHSFGWPTVEAYYAGSSSSDSIPQVATPLLCIQALDDPIAPAEAIPYQALSRNPHTLLVTTTSGGHLGWVSGDQGPLGHPWM
ncbi:Alpha/Beta hydrolase protein [Haematococcus lacustris]